MEQIKRAWNNSLLDGMATVYTDSLDFELICCFACKATGGSQKCLRGNISH